ncbi:hypothetical protein WUBG_05208 [Wuchereria bancrofti]|uniref:Uncharacterized protein n=1 Tax=Wuchereria bancrofti TaxID=6293 RepID=J9ENW1_WUCBA|nr:hypothetical protein WUBG_05208 [Wuchereria bancrofti]
MRNSEDLLGQQHHQLNNEQPCSVSCGDSEKVIPIKQSADPFMTVAVKRAHVCEIFKE